MAEERFSKGLPGRPVGPTHEPALDDPVSHPHSEVDDTAVIPAAGESEAPATHGRAFPAARSEAVPARRTFPLWPFVLRVGLSAIAAAGLVLSAFMPWVRGTNGVSLDIQALWETTFSRENQIFIATVGFVAIILGLLALIGIAPASGWLTRLAGVLAIAMFVLLLVQVYRADLTVEAVDGGPWVALGSGVVAVAAGFFGGRRPDVLA